MRFGDGLTVRVSCNSKCTAQRDSCHTTRRHQSCRSTSLPGRAKEHDAINTRMLPGACPCWHQVETKCAYTFKELGQAPLLFESHHQLSTVTSGNHFQTRSQDHARPAGVPDCRLGCVPAAVQVKTARAVKRTSRTWAAAASAHLCGRFWRRFFCRPPLSLAVAGASDHKTLRRSAEDVISCLMGARQRPRFRTRACQLTQARRRVTTIHATALGTSTRAGEAHGFAKHACRSGARSAAAHRRPHALHKDLRSAFSIYGWRPIRSDKAHCPL